MRLWRIGKGTGLMKLVVGSLFLVVAVILTSCGTTATPEPTEQPTETGHQEEEVANLEEILSAAALPGLQVYRSVGCATCHGFNAEGSDVAPALPGHNESQVRRQVRAPVGLMPVFTLNTMSDEQLDELVMFIADLGGEHAHMASSGTGDEMEMHHWMALFALEDDHIGEARHHIDHIIKITEGDHQSRMRQVLSDIEAAGDLHDATHAVEEMLAGMLSDEITEGIMHLKMALSSARIDEAQSVVHHMEHFAALVSADADHEAADEVIATAQAGDLEGAEHHIAEMLEAAGITEVVAEAHDEDEAAHDDGEVPHDEDAHAEETPTT